MVYAFFANKTYINLDERRIGYPFIPVELTHDVVDGQSLRCYLSKEDAIAEKEEMRDRYLEWSDMFDSLMIRPVDDILFEKGYLHKDLIY